MPRADADDPWEYIFPSRCYALAGLQLHLSVRRSPHVATALKPASATSLRYSASRRGENRPRKATGCVFRRRLRRPRVARACSRTGQRWVRTGPMAGVTVTRYDALR